MSPALRSSSWLLIAAVAAPATLVPRSAQAQAPAPAIFDAKTAAHIRDAYLADMDTLHSKVMQLANAIPEAKYSWRPTPEVRTISEVFMHVAGEWYFYMPRAFAGNAPADFGAPREKLTALEKTVTTKAAVIAELEKSWAHGRKEVASANVAALTGKYKPFGIPIDEAALVMADDLHEHLGQLIVYARSVGVKPPWSK